MLVLADIEISSQGPSAAGISRQENLAACVRHLENGGGGAVKYKSKDRQTIIVYWAYGQ